VFGGSVLFASSGSSKLWKQQASPKIGKYIQIYNIQLHIPEHLNNATQYTRRGI
jgi:hypothetical protein